jgi:hypothetical protein
VLNLVYLTSKVVFRQTATFRLSAATDGSLQVHAQEPEKSPKPVDVTVDLEDLTPGVSTISAAASSTASPVPSSSTTDPENGDCGVTVGCFYDTAGNVVKYSATADGLNIHFEIICQRSTSGYCAVGFSNDTLMVSLFPVTSWFVDANNSYLFTVFPC